MPIPAGLHIDGIDARDDGKPRLLLVHGSHWRRPETLYRAQAPLTAHFQLLTLHRRGYGNSAPVQRTDAFEPDVSDVRAALDAIGMAHVLADSYGALAVLLAAQRSASGIATMTLIEPVAFQLAEHDLAARPFIDALKSAMHDRDRSKPELFAARFLSANRGVDVQPRPLSDEARQAVLAMMSEAPPWTAEIDLPKIRSRAIPTHVICGGWNPAFSAVCRAIADGLAAPLHTITGFGHRPQDAGAPLNDLVLALSRVT